MDCVHNDPRITRRFDNFGVMMANYRGVTREVIEECDERLGSFDSFYEAFQKGMEELTEDAP